MKVFRLLSICLLVLGITVSCGDDYFENGIEGRWQLREVLSPQGEVSSVDTVFYSFKKGVFEYRKLLTPTQYFECYGMYEEKVGDSLQITIDDSYFDPEDCESCLDWEDLSRTFHIRKRTSSRMELDLNGVIYKFRKY